MRRHRTTARAGTLTLLLVVGLAATVLAAPASSGLEQGVPRLVHPLVAKTLLWDNYGDPRGNGSHAGIDMENPWRAPVVAVEDGRVEYATSGLGGCMLYLFGESGTMYMYIHLNNDVTARNDNTGGCVKDTTYAVPNGARVTAGEQVAWNGDSGDANGNPHLHFEVHPNGGTDVNPFKHLKRAIRPLFASKRGVPFSLGLRGTLVGAGAGTLTLEATKARHYPGGRWLDIDAREVELTVPPDALVADELAGIGRAEYRSFKAPLPVTAYTARAKTTAESIAGTAGALQLSRISPIQ